MRTRYFVVTDMFWSLHQCSECSGSKISQMGALTSSDSKGFSIVLLAVINFLSAVWETNWCSLVINTLTVSSLPLPLILHSFYLFCFLLFSPPITFPVPFLPSRPHPSLCSPPSRWWAVNWTSTTWQGSSTCCWWPWVSASWCLPGSIWCTGNYGTVWSDLGGWTSFWLSAGWERAANTPTYTSTNTPVYQLAKKKNQSSNHFFNYWNNYK